MVVDVAADVDVDRQGGPSTRRQHLRRCNCEAGMEMEAMEGVCGAPQRSGDAGGSKAAMTRGGPWEQPSLLRTQYAGSACTFMDKVVRMNYAVHRDSAQLLGRCLKLISMCTAGAGGAGTSVSPLLCSCVVLRPHFGLP